MYSNDCLWIPPVFLFLGMCGMCVDVRQPKIVWMKNKMIIGDNPKFIMQNNQGVLTLNIRKPGKFDGGNYTCRAINDLGVDEVECRLEIRGMAPETTVPIIPQFCDSHARCIPFLIYVSP